MRAEGIQHDGSLGVADSRFTVADPRQGIGVGSASYVPSVVSPEVGGIRSVWDEMPLFFSFLFIIPFISFAGAE